MSLDRHFIDNPNKTTVNENDIIPGTDSIGGRDVFWYAKTLRDWIIGQVHSSLASPGAGFDAVRPPNPYLGQVWFDPNDGNRIWVWDGTEWRDVQRVIDEDDFGLGVKPIARVNALPETGEQGDVVFLLTDNKLYRWDGNEWTAEVESADITGQLVAAQIADAAITVAKFAAGLRPVEIVATLPSTGNTPGRTVFLTADNKLYRWTGSAWTTAVPAADITGTLTDAQISALAAAKITGTLTNDQIAAVAAAKLTGQIVATQITDGAISTPKLAAGAVTADIIAASAVVADKLAANAVTTAKLDAGAVTTAKLAAAAVEAGNIAASAITTDKLAANAVTTDKITANAITTGLIAAGAVKADQIAAGEVTATQLAADSVTASKIATNAIQAYHVEAGAIDVDKLAANAVTAGKISAGAVTATAIGTNEIIATSANVKDGVITNAKIANLDAAKINAGNIGAVNIGRSGRIYNPSYPANYFRTVEMRTGTNTSWNWGSGGGFTFSHDTGVRMYGPGQGGLPRFNPDDSGIINIIIFAQIIGYAGISTIYYRKNGSGSYIAISALASDDGGNSRHAIRRQITGLSATDYLDFYIAPCDGNGDLTADSITKHWDLDVMAFNF